MSKTIKIANGQGFWGDSIQAPIDLVKEGNIDYLTLDYLAEVTLSIMQKQKNKNSHKGYAYDFIEFLQQSHNDIIKNNIKIITNAGGVNPICCSLEVKKILQNKNKNYKIGIISGDDILDNLDMLISNGADFTNIDTGEKIDKILNNICSANVYIDSFTIKEALDLGAQIVLAGRVTDPGLCLGPMLHEYSWNKKEYNKIASGTLAGHIIECGAQCTGGNHTKWNSIPDLTNIGYPIIDIKENGDFLIKKNKNTGGIINRNTVAEQILYEMGNPKKYLSPDVTVDFTSFNLIDNFNDTVSIKSVQGSEPTDTYKVSISYFSGYKSSGQLTVSGPNAIEKAEYASQLVWNRLKINGCEYEESNTEFLGLSSCQKSLSIKPDVINEVVLRLSVKDVDKNKVKRFGKEIAPLITNGPPGITGFSGGRPKVQEVIAFWPALIKKEFIKTNVTIL